MDTIFKGALCLLQAARRRTWEATIYLPLIGILIMSYCTIMPTFTDGGRV
jgi:hypothetical protein